MCRLVINKYNIWQFKKPRALCNSCVVGFLILEHEKIGDVVTYVPCVKCIGTKG